jgi:hypothetical protein
MSAELKIKISGDGSGFAATLDKAKAQASGFAGHLAGDVGKGFSKSFLGVIPGIQHAIANIFDPQTILAKIDELVSRAKQIKLGSIRTQLNTDDFQRYSKTLESVGLDAGTAVMAIGRLAHAQEEVKNGSVDGTKNTVKLAEAYAALGVTVDDLRTKTPQQLFAQISDSMKDVAASGQVTGEQMSAIKEIFGKGGLEMLPVWAKGFDTLAASLGNLDPSALKQLTEFAKVKALGGAIVDTAVTDTLTGQNPVVGALGAGSAIGGIVGLVGGWLKSLNASTEEDPTMKALREKSNKQQREKADKQVATLAETGEGKTATKAEAAVEEQRKKNALAAGGPEAKRAALLEDIAAREREIAEIKAYADAGSYSAAEARTLAAKEQLEIEKARGELGQLDKPATKEGAKSASATRATDRLTQIGLDVASVPVRGPDAATRYYAAMMELTQKQNKLVADQKAEVRRLCGIME